MMAMMAGLHLYLVTRLADDPGWPPALARALRWCVVLGGLSLVLYPIARVVLEMIRSDNPHDTAGLTISQFVSASMFLGGIAYLFVLYRWMPERSPAVKAVQAS